MPRAGLNEDRVVEAAVVIADDVGLSNLTLASLAEKLGVRQPSLYKHVSGITGLKRSISIRAKVGLADVLARAAVGRSGGDAILSMSRAYRKWALEHPGRYEAAQWAPAPGDVEDEVVSGTVVKICADVLIAYELEGVDAIDAIRAFRSMLHGFVSLESSGAFGLPVDIDHSFERLVRGLVTAFASWSEVSEKPDQEKPDQEKPDQEKPDQEKPDQEKPDQEKPDQEKPDQAEAVAGAVANRV